MSKRKKQTGRYVVEINDWGCGTMIKDTLTGKEIDAPAEETVNLCLVEMNRLAAEVERLVKAGDAMAVCLEAYNRCKPYDGPMTLDCLKSWKQAKEGKPSV